VRITWREAVKNVAQAAGFSQAALAGNAGLYPMQLTRYLKRANAKGAYPPTQKHIFAISRAAALLAELPEIEAYLNAVAGLEELLPPHGAGESDASFLLDFVEEFDPYFEGGAQRAILETSSPLSERERWEIVRMCAVARGRELVRRLAGKPPKPAGLSEFIWIFRDAGVPLDLALRHGEPLVHRLLRDGFEATVCETIAQIDGKSSAASIAAARVISMNFALALSRISDQNFTASIAKSLSSLYSTAPGQRPQSDWFNSFLKSRRNESRK
jgi:transcriptional regulator with XRE-family HTH domain